MAASRKQQEPEVTAYQISLEENNFKMLDQVEDLLKVFSVNLEDLDGNLISSTIPDLGPDLDRLQKETQQLKCNLESLCTEQFQTGKQTALQLKAELAQCHKKCDLIKTEREKEQLEVAKLRGEVQELQDQLLQQSEFCASLGSVLGTLLWKASRSNSVVDTIMAGTKITELICIVSGTLESFMEAYVKHLPTQQSEEYQFMMSLCGTITNIAATPTGRQFLATSANGKELLSKFIKALALMKSSTGGSLKKLMLMALYNISINENGLAFLHDQPDLLHVISSSVQSDSVHECKIMCLKLLQSITYDIKDGETLIKITNNVPMAVLHSIVSSSNEELRTEAQEIIVNLQTAHYNLKQ